MRRKAAGRMVTVRDTTLLQSESAASKAARDKQADQEGKT
jgi:hypothetical protein